MRPHELLKFLSALTCITSLITGCSPDAQTKEIPVKTDVVELARLINLPSPPQTARWQVLQSGNAGGLGPNDWALAAVLDMGTENRQRLVEQAEEAHVDTLFPKVFVLDWFPAALKSLWSNADAGAYTLMVKPLDAKAFESPPLQNGFFVPFGDAGEVFVYLHTQ